MDNLIQKSCTPCEGGTPPLTGTEVTALLGQLQGWQADSANTAIERDFRFKNFHQTMAFANALAWIAHQEDHHPDLEIGYGHCRVRYRTHAIDGLSENDFICAAKVDALVRSA